MIETERDRPADASALPDNVAKSYAYPSELTEPWVRMNFVASVDGAATVQGRSGGLTHPADKEVYDLIRDRADVVLVGAGTAIAEGYRGVRDTAKRRARRAAWGMPPVPPIAVVSNGGSLDPRAAVLTETLVPAVVVTCSDNPRVDAYRAAGAEVVLAGERRVDLAAGLAQLGARGWSRVACEGGPGLFAALLAADRVDEVCLTVSPLLAASAGGPRILSAGPSESCPLWLASAAPVDGALLLRYHTERARRRISGNG
jgi:5-amino-6-(5-phosphoribosylamino)uracil reductase